MAKLVSSHEIAGLCDTLPMNIRKNHFSKPVQDLIDCYIRTRAIEKERRTRNVSTLSSIVEDPFRCFDMDITDLNHPQFSHLR